MTVEAYWAQLEARFGLTRVHPAQDGNWLCTDRNHTHFEIPDPAEMPDDATRADALEFIASHLARYALGY
ncbi:hypothetical protein [Glycocaulis sp.]